MLLSLMVLSGSGAAGFETKLMASDGAEWAQFGYAVHLDQDLAIIGAASEQKAYIFRWDGVNWVEEAVLTENEGNYGYPVAIEGNVAAVGSRCSALAGPNCAGAVFIYEWNGATWTQREAVTASDASEWARFGSSLDIDGNRIIVGARNADGDGAIGNGLDRGAAYVFRRDGTNWIEEAKLNRTFGYEDGYDVAIDGGHAAVGAPRGEEVALYRLDGTEWIQETTIRSSSNWFGSAVAISGGHLAVGAIFAYDHGSSSGAAFSYRWNGGSWIETSDLLPSDIAGGMHFGSSIAVSGDTAVVGASDGTGAAYVFTWDGTVWAEAAKILPSDGHSGDYFGDAAGIFGDVALVGAWGQEELGEWAGAAYVYVEDGDNDGLGWEDNCLAVSNADQADYDGDGTGDVCDADTDGDGVANDVDLCPVGEVGWVSTSETDHEGDGCRDLTEDSDDDNDAISDVSDACSPGDVGWTSNSSSDHDGDGCRDAGEDLDDDNDGVLDDADGCTPGELRWASSSQTDHDGDGCRDAGEDPDDDNDGVPDSTDGCPLGETGWTSTLLTDHDEDGCRGDTEDLDDDNDGISDEVDACPRGETGWTSASETDHDGDGCRGAGGPPMDVAARLVEGPGTIEVSWSAPHDSEVRGYHLFRGEAADALAFHVEVGPAELFLDEGVTYGSTFFYAVSALTASEGELSGVVNATFVDEVPPVVEADWPDVAWLRESVVVPVVESDGPTGLEGCSANVVSASLVSVDAARPCNEPYLVSVGEGAVCRDDGVAVCRVVLGARDWVGNEAEVEAVFSVDFTPPSTSRVLSGAHGLEDWWTSPVSVELACADATSGCDGTTWVLDDASQAYAGPFELAQDGVFELSYRSEDVAGNVEAERSEVVAVDQTPPTTTASLAGEQGLEDWFVGPVEVCFHPVDRMSGVSATHFIVDGGDVEESSCRSLDEDGVHEVAFWSVDVAGNVEPVRIVEVKVDQRPPVSGHEIVGIPGLKDWWVSDVEVVLSCADVTSGCGASYLAADISAPVAGLVHPFYDGVHGLAYHSVDVAGNLEPSHPFTLKVDTVPPVVALLEPVEGQAYLYDYLIPNPTPQYTWLIGEKTLVVDASDVMSGVGRVEFWIDGYLRAVVGQAPYEWVWPAGEEVQGNHTIRVVAYDVAGNVAFDEREVLTMPTSTESFLGDPGSLPPGWVEEELFEVPIPLPGDGSGTDPVTVDLLEVRGEPDPENPAFYLLYTRVAGQEPPGLNPMRVPTVVTLPPVHVRLLEVPALGVPLPGGDILLRATFRYDPDNLECGFEAGQSCYAPLPLNPGNPDWVPTRGARAALVVESVAVLEGGLVDAIAPDGSGPLVLGETVVVPFVGQVGGVLPS